MLRIIYSVLAVLTLLVLLPSALAQPCDCDKMLLVQYDSLAIQDDRSSNVTLKKWYTSTDFRNWKNTEGRSIDVAFKGFSLSADADDEKIGSWQRKIMDTHESAVSQSEKFSYLSSKGLEAVVNGYVKCIEVVKSGGGMASIGFASDMPSGAGQSVITLIFLHPRGDKANAVIRENGVTLVGLEEVGDKPVLSGGSTIPPGTGVSVAYKVIPDFRSPKLVVNTDEGSVVVSVPESLTPAEASRRACPAELDSLKRELATVKADRDSLRVERDELRVRAGELQKWTDLDGKVFSGLAGDPLTKYIVWGHSRIPCQRESAPFVDSLPQVHDCTPIIGNVPHIHRQLYMNGAGPYPDVR